MLQNAGFGTIPCGGGGGGVVANREPGSYISQFFSEEYLILKYGCSMHFVEVSSIFIHFQQVCPNASSRYRDVWCARVDDLAKAEPDGFCAGQRPRTAEPCPDTMDR